MAYEGVDLTAEAGQVFTSFSWHIPHPIFVVVMVGPPGSESVFGLQKDILCARSPYFADHFAAQGMEDKLEHLVKLPETDKDTFGCFQNYVYTGEVYDKVGGHPIPEYSLLMSLWKLATKLKMAPLRVAILDVMADRRQQTSCIPGPELLIQAWKETKEGSGLRKILLAWTAEYMRASPHIRNTLAKSLPHEILSELVVLMSDSATTFQTPVVPSAKHHLVNDLVDPSPEPDRPAAKRGRKSDKIVLFKPLLDEEEYGAKPKAKKVVRKSEPSRSKGHRMSGNWSFEATPVSPEQDLEDCKAMIGRMLSAPSYWTRYIKSFREPVDPVRDFVPNYFDVVKRPMDLTTIGNKMSRGEYASAGEFEADIRLIFQNAYEYWTQDDPVFKECETFETFFNKQWSARHNKNKVKIEVME